MYEYPEFKAHIDALLKATGEPIYNWMVKCCKEFDSNPNQINEKQFLYLFHCALKPLVTDEVLTDMLFTVDSERQDTASWN